MTDAAINPDSDATGGASFTIADEVFTAMIDGEEGHLSLWQGDRPPAPDFVYAWVRVDGPLRGRVLLSLERSAATQISRALLMLGDGEVVSPEDFLDAVGEVANVIGGNLKALAPEGCVLTLPEVSAKRPADEGTVVSEVALAWRGQLIIITICMDPVGGDH